MSISISYSGQTPRLQFQWTVAINKWADAVGPLVLAEMRAQAPVASGPNAGTGMHAPGTLKRSIRYSRATTAGNITITFMGYAPYTKYVISGTGAHPIFPNTKRYLHFYGGDGSSVFVGPKGDQNAHVNHPGTQPNPFPTRAMERVSDEVQSIFNDIMTEALGMGSEE